MWKIKLVYSDGGQLTLTGKHKDIPLELAYKYHNKYVVGHLMRKATYQQYPKNYYVEMELAEKIEKLGVN